MTNPRSERVRSVRALAGRSVRQRAGRFLAEGPQAVREAVAAQAEAHEVSRSGARRVHDLYVTSAALERHAGIVDVAHRGGVRVHEVSDEVLAAMSETVTPQGLLAVCSLVTVPLPQALAAAPRLVAVLSRVRDPGNAGTVLRAADAAGAGAVVLSADSVDVHNPKCVRSTAGSLFHLPVVSGAPLVEVLAAVRDAGCTVLAASGDGEHDLDDLLDAAAAGDVPAGAPDLRRPTAWLFGNEAQGLSADEREAADAVVRVPVHGRAESLNLATAATVCLYASARAQRRR
ncbi:TrmH family RNA methyltransferase [Kineococcus xinjiangensis]|uniref:TrmH family RNA methyltransferase n=1 Tax=Kineococcus xinjiangensis TaxID=512762 RepID=UPI000CEC0EC6